MRATTDEVGACVVGSDTRRGPVQLGIEKRLRVTGPLPIVRPLSEADRRLTADKADMAVDPTAGGAPIHNIGTEADLMLHQMLARIARRRAHRLAMRDGHPSVAAGRRQPATTEQLAERDLLHGRRQEPADGLCMLGWARDDGGTSAAGSEPTLNDHARRRTPPTRSPLRNPPSSSGRPGRAPTPSPAIVTVEPWDGRRRVVNQSRVGGVEIGEPVSDGREAAEPDVGPTPVQPAGQRATN